MPIGKPANHGYCQRLCGGAAAIENLDLAYPAAVATNGGVLSSGEIGAARFELATRWFRAQLVPSRGGMRGINAVLRARRGSS